MFRLKSKHRIKCGDSTSEDDVGKLMGGEKADMVFTDPPYALTSGGHKSDKGMVLGGDKLNTGKLFEIPNPKDWIPLMPLAKDCDIYIMSNDKNLLEFMNVLNDNKIKLHNLLVMRKSNAVPNRWYLKNCEYTFYGWKGKAKKINDMTSVTCEDVKAILGEGKVHVSQKPIEYIENKITNSSEKNHRVYEPFLGSGSTLIACEKTDRKCYGMEIDTKYINVILKRYSDYCGGSIVKA